MATIKKIEHIGIQVSDMERSVNFYTEVLGLRLRERMTVNDGALEIAFIEVGESLLELLCFAEGQMPPADGLVKHVCFTVDDAGAFLRQLKAKRVQVNCDEPQLVLNDRARNFFFAGPDGEQLEVFEWTS